MLRCYRGTGCRSMGTRPRRRSRRNIQNNSTGTGTDRSCGEIDGATSASIAGTVVTVNVPVQPAGQVYHVMLDCLFA